MSMTLADLVRRHTIRCACGSRIRTHGHESCTRCRLAQPSVEMVAHYRRLDAWAELARLWRPVVAVTLKRESRERKARLYEHRARLRALEAMR